MGLRERDRTGTEHPDHTPAPRATGPLRRLLALVAAVGALIAFTTLARPAASPSSRLTIGSEPDQATDSPEEEGGREAAADAGTADADDADADERSAAGSGGGSAEPEAMLRPLDPATLADVPANILALRRDQWPRPSEDGELLAVPDFFHAGHGEVRVLDGQTLQPVTTVEVDGTLTGFHGFTSDGDALVVQVRRGNRRILLRSPLDPDEPVTEVDLPAGVDSVGPEAAMLTAGRVALVVADSGTTDTTGDASGPRVLVADLRSERLALDLPLPVRATFNLGNFEPDVSYLEPGFAWDAARERLYVAHADAARVTVVDLTTGTVLADAEVGPPIADLGGEPGHRWRWAEVSPDGERLYTGGAQLLQTASDPFGLSVIDTRTLTEVEHMSRVSEWMQLSPDGRWLLWTAADITSSGYLDPGRPDARRGVALMDTTQIGQVTLLGGPDASPLGFSRDSAHVYLQREQEGGTTVVAHALPSLSRTGERLLPRGAWFNADIGLLWEEAEQG